MTTELQLAAARTEPDGLLRAARICHVLEEIRGIEGHSVKFEHCQHGICVAARELSGLDERQIELFARSHGKREPGE